MADCSKVMMKEHAFTDGRNVPEARKMRSAKLPVLNIGRPVRWSEHRLDRWGLKMVALGRDPTPHPRVALDKALFEAARAGRTNARRYIVDSQKHKTGERTRISRYLVRTTRPKNWNAAHTSRQRSNGSDRADANSKNRTLIEEGVSYLGHGAKGIRSPGNSS